MKYVGTFDRKIFHNPSNRFCIVVIRTADRTVPEPARDKGIYGDGLLRFTAVGYEIPFSDAVKLELEGEWENGKYGMQFQVKKWREIVPETEEGVSGYLASGLLKGIGEKTAARIVAKFGVKTLDILETCPERLLEVRGITKERLEDIKTSFAESRMLRDIMLLLAPFKLTPGTALSVYRQFGPSSVKVLKENPYALCQIPGFGFRRVDEIMKKVDHRPHDPMRIKGALHYALDEAEKKQKHLFLEKTVLYQEALRLLNGRAWTLEQRVQKEEVKAALESMALDGAVVSVDGWIYHPSVFAQEDETADRIARLLAAGETDEADISVVMERVKEALGIRISGKQEAAVRTAFRYPLSIITGSPGTGKTTVLKMILETYRKRYPDREAALMAPTGRASRRMAESTGFEGACTLHSRLGLTGERAEEERKEGIHPLKADLVIVDECSMVDMWLAHKFFMSLEEGTKVVLVGDPDQLPSVGAGNVFRELISCGLVPVTVLDEIFRQAKGSRIACNARRIHAGDMRLDYGEDFVFLPCRNQAEAASALIERYCKEIERHGIERVQILSPYRTEGAASSDHLNAAIQEIVNPFRSEEEEIRMGAKTFRIGDRIMQTKNTGQVSNGDLGFIRYLEDAPDEKRIGLDFGEGRSLEYGMRELAHLDLAYATTIHKAMGSEYDIVLMPVLRAHSIMLYRNLLYTGITRAKKAVVLAGQKDVLAMAVHRNETGKRNTGLGERIRMHYGAYAPDDGAASEVPEKILKAIS